MKFLIQYNLMAESQLEAVKSAALPYPHQYVGVIPFSNEITTAEGEEIVGTDYIPYGSTLMSTIGLDLGWKGLYFDLEQFNYEAAVANRDDMLNDGAIMTVEETIDFMRASTQEQWFIRPSLDLKHFAGQVIERIECVKWLTQALSCSSSETKRMYKDMKIVVATPQNIQAEWRWFVVGGKVVDGSMYRSHGQLIKQHETDPKVIAEAQTFADKWSPNRNVVMDLALVDNELKVIEFNCINCSGFYNHNVRKIFDALYMESTKC